MAQAAFSGEEINRMKADAVMRARQMQSKTAFRSNPMSSSQNAESRNQNKQNSNAFPFNLPIAKNVNGLISSLGLSSDQIIILAIILMLAQDKENLPLVVALLYIAM